MREALGEMQRIALRQLLEKLAASPIRLPANLSEHF